MKITNLISNAIKNTGKILCLFSACAIAIEAHADLTIDVNSVNKTIELVGSDAGTVSGTQKFQWDSGVQSGVSAQISDIPASLLL